MTGSVTYSGYFSTDKAFHVEWQGHKSGSKAADRIADIRMLRADQLGKRACLEGSDIGGAFIIFDHVCAGIGDSRTKEMRELRT
jgi:hypothetical protein